MHWKFFLGENENRRENAAGQKKIVNLHSFRFRLQMKWFNRDTWLEYRERYRRWQKVALTYEFKSPGTNHCANCDHDYQGNYCPYCSQKQGLGRIGWATVRSGLMEVWGLHSRSMPYSVLQLMFRPGFFISDYINGKRQISFPPVKMLVILGIASVLIDKLTHRNHIKDRVAERISNGRFDFMASFLAWFQANPGWGWLLVNMFLLIPVWLLFRHAPRNSKHTLPQGFFILVFLSLIVLIYDNIADCTFSIFYFFIPFYYIFAFKQLFGFNVWSTIWRTTIMFASGFLMLMAVGMTYEVHVHPSMVGHTIWEILLLIAASFGVVGIGVGLDRLGDYLSKKKKTDTAKTGGSTAE